MARNSLYRPTPPPQQTPRGATTVDRALQVVAEVLDRGGEAALRLADVSRRSSVSVGSLYHHFGSREGLVSAARERQFLDSLPGDAAEAVEFLEGASTPREFLERLRDMLERGEEAPRAAGRRRRFEMIGAAARRPGHLQGIVAVQTSYLDLIEGMVMTLQDRGWLKRDANPRALAVLLHGLSMTRVLAEIDEAPVDPEAWRDVVCHCIECFLVSDQGELRQAS